MLSTISTLGTAKSLLNLFYELKDTNHEIDLMILNQEDSLTEYLPDYVNVKPVNTRFSVLMLNRKHLISKMINNYSTPKLVLNAFLFILKSKLKLHDTTKAKQQFWVDNKWVDSTLKTL